MIEGIKNTLFMRGNKSSNSVINLMKDLVYYNFIIEITSPQS